MVNGKTLWVLFLPKLYPSNQPSLPACDCVGLQPASCLWNSPDGHRSPDTGANKCLWVLVGFLQNPCCSPFWSQAASGPVKLELCKHPHGKWNTNSLPCRHSRSLWLIGLWPLSWFCSEWEVSDHWRVEKAKQIPFKASLWWMYTFLLKWLVIIDRH